MLSMSLALYDAFIKANLSSVLYMYNYRYSVPLTIT